MSQLLPLGSAQEGTSRASLLVVPEWFCLHCTGPLLPAGPVITLSCYDAIPLCAPLICYNAVPLSLALL